MRIVRRLWPIAVILLAGLLIYGRSLSNGAVNWDDETFLTSRAILDFDFTSIFSGTTVHQYYPLTILSMAADFALCGPTPQCLHVGSLIWHLLSSILVFALALEVFEVSVPWALLASLLFLAHPLNVEAVSWLAARNHILAGFFDLAVLLAYWRYLRGDRKKLWYGLTLIVFVCALLAKVTAVMLPLGLLFMDFVSGRRDRKKSFWEKVPFLLVALPFAVVALRAQQVGSFPAVFELSISARILWVLRGIVFYLGRIVLPLHLSPYYDLHAFALSGVDILGFALAIVLFVGMPWRVGRERAAWLGIGFFVLCFLPISKLYPFGEDSIFNDRYMYFAIGVLACSLALGLSRLRSSRFQRIAFALATIVVSVFSFLAHRQTMIWKDSESVWNQVIQNYPKTSIAYFNLGSADQIEKKYEDAAANYERSIALNPDSPLPYFNLGFLRYAQGDVSSALKLYQRAVDLNPNLSIAYQNIGEIQIQLHQYDEAEKNLKKALALAPELGQAYFGLGQLSLVKGQRDEAIGFFQKAVIFEPQLRALVEQYLLKTPH